MSFYDGDFDGVFGGLDNEKVEATEISTTDYFKLRVVYGSKYEYMTVLLNSYNRELLELLVSENCPKFLKLQVNENSFVHVRSDNIITFEIVEV